MIELATANTPDEVELVKIDGQRLPFEDKTFDIVFSATVLQHNTDEKMMQAILKEMCRVSADRVILFERVESHIKGDDLCKGRPIEYFASICNEVGFELKQYEFLNIRTSYLVCGAIRKGLNPSSRKEGEPLNGISLFLQKATLPVTKQLDKIFKANRDLTKMEFIRIKK